ncbi:hypothetical protein AZA_12843 [Nitrospirillum viridazoti Y2]|nr:hypothetical protein AZA_12843 [Nitrospirillum amazonense Y2]
MSRLGKDLADSSRWGEIRRTRGHGGSGRGIRVRNRPAQPSKLKGTATGIEGTATKIKGMATDSGRLAPFPLKGSDTIFRNSRVQQPSAKGSVTRGPRVRSPQPQGSETGSRGNGNQMSY